MIFFQFLFGKGKGEGSEHPNLPEWFQYNFFFIFWGTDRGLLVSLLLLFFFQFRYPLDMYLILSVVLSTLPYVLFFSNIEKVTRKNEIKRKCAAV